MISKKALKKLLEKNASLTIVGLALLMVTVLTVIEATHMLPLEGRATPMYTPLTTPSAKLRNAAPRKPSMTQKRKVIRIQRRSAASQRSLRSATSVSSSVSSKAE